ncbi:MAG: hypothetical protein CBE16_09745 [Rhodospirillaceae bacterium TMED256]|nr:MAG: hypothetical protein CBE16_09745 [Rhodospirillaceae bacterium TMED256]
MFFGEMSLLTGAPQSAAVGPSVDSVVFVITRSDLEFLMMRRPAMSDQLSEVPAERQPWNMRLLDEEKGAGALETLTSLSWQFLSGIQMYCMMAVPLILPVV